MRLLTLDRTMQCEPWRLRLWDELQDIQEKLRNLRNASEACDLVRDGDELLNVLMTTGGISRTVVADEVAAFAGEAYEFVCADRVLPFETRLRGVSGGFQKGAEAVVVE